MCGRGRGCGPVSTRVNPEEQVAGTSTQVKILVPGSQSMVSLLGERDELLKLIEAAFDSHILVRGNEITIEGDPVETERVALLFEELLSLIGAGQVLTAESLSQTIDLIKENEVRPTDVM